jgi:hypothetical protein
MERVRLDEEQSWKDCRVCKSILRVRVPFSPPFFMKKTVANFKNLSNNEQQVIDLYLQSTPLKEIGNKFGVYANSVIRFLKERGIYKSSFSEKKIIESFQSRLQTNSFNTMSIAGIRKWMKRILIIEYGHKCNICSLTEWQGKPIPLVCDHIDGDITNNLKSNFRLVCPNCDALLPTFKSKNRRK